MIHRIHAAGRYLYEKRYTEITVLYLFSLVVLIFVIPFLIAEFNLTMLLYRTFLLFFIFLSALIAQHKLTVTFLVSLLSMITVTYIHLGEKDNDLLSVRISILAVYLSITLYNIIQDIIQSQVSFRIVIQTLNGYLVIGLIFGELLKLVHILDPGAFNFSLSDIYNHFFLSFISLTSVGMGDVHPVSPGAKAVVLLCSVTGQVYSVFFASIIVGKFLGRSSTKHS